MYISFIPPYKATSPKTQKKHIRRTSFTITPDCLYLRHEIYDHYRPGIRGNNPPRTFYGQTSHLSHSIRFSIHHSPVPYPDRHHTAKHRRKTSRFTKTIPTGRRTFFATGRYYLYPHVHHHDIVRQLSHDK